MLRPVTIRNVSTAVVTFNGHAIPSHGTLYVSMAEYVEYVKENDISSLAIVVSLPTAELRNVSVKDFGAVGDGMTNDTYAIQSAIDSVATHGGGVVSIPVGVYLVDGIVVHGDVSLRGESRLGSVLRQTANSDTACVSVTGDAVTISNMTIRGM